jgi:hypothetical protein
MILYKAAKIPRKKKENFNFYGPSKIKKNYLSASGGKKGLERMNTALENLPCSPQSLGRT